MKTSSKTEFIYACLIAVFVFVIYGNTINHGYNFDDEYVILNQQVQQGIKAIPDIFTSKYFTSEDQSYGYRPITKVTFAIEYSFFGLNPKISHIINLLLYALTGILLFYFFIKNFKAYPQWFWLLATILFLSHPIHTEVVNSLKNREEILSFLFGLLSILYVFKYSKTSNFKNLFISVLGVSASILSKESGVLFLGFYLVFLITSKLSKVDLEKMSLLKIPKVKNPVKSFDPFLAIVMITFSFMVIFSFFNSIGLIAIINQAICTAIAILVINYKIFILKKPIFHNKKQNIIWFIFSLATPFHHEGIGPIIYLILAGYISVDYFSEFFKTNKQSLSNAANYLLKVLGIISGSAILASLVFASVYYLPRTLLATQQIKLAKNQTPLTYTENSWASFKLSGEVFVKYLSMLFYPEKLLFYYGYNTIPIPEDFNLNLAFFVVFALGLTLILFFIKHTKSAFLFVFFLLVGMLFFSNLPFEVPGIIGDRLMYVASLGFCGLLALGLYELYKLQGNFSKVASIILAASILILYSSKTISRNADWQNKSTLYNADVKHLENSARANMIYADLLFGQAQEKLTENNLEDAKNMFEASAFYYEKSLKVDSSNFTVYNNLGTIYLSFLADPEKAKYFLKQGLSKRFANYYAYNNLGMIYEELQKPDSALMYFKKSIDLNPTNTEGNFGMARVLHQQNKFEEAFTYYVKVLEKNPREIEAHEKMGDLLLQMGDTSNAIRFYQNVLKINSSRIDVEQKLEKLSY